jgi:uncharacterized lipoprotein YbaY/heat shock protein HslJ
MSPRLSLASLSALAALTLITACSPSPTVEGTASYRERMALPPEAVLEVVLEDISLADAPAAVIASTTVDPAGQPPIAWSVAYDEARIDSARSYAVRARITAGDQLLFVTDQVYPVLTRGHGATVPLMLVRAAGDQATMRGMYRYLADAAVFTDCATGRRLPVAIAEDHISLERAYLAQRPAPGAPVLVTFQGRIEQRPPMEGDGTVATVVIERFEGIWPGETCGNPGATEALENTYWKLTRLRGAPVVVHPDQREPHLVLRADGARLTGSGGCNGFQGGYVLDGASLSFGQAAATMMMCPEGMEQEQAFLQALAAVASWRIEGQHLELLDPGGAVVLRLEARAMP